MKEFVKVQERTRSQEAAGFFLVQGVVTFRHIRLHGVIPFSHLGWHRWPYVFCAHLVSLIDVVFGWLGIELELLELVICLDEPFPTSHMWLGELCENYGLVGELPTNNADDVLCVLCGFAPVSCDVNDVYHLNFPS